MTKLSKVDWDIIDARVRTTKAAHKLTTASMALLWLALEQFFPEIDEQLLEIITDAPDDRGVDAIHIVENDAHAVVYIFQSKYRDTSATTDRTINDSEVLRISLFL